MAADDPLILVLATANPHKVAEIRSVLATANAAVDLRPRPEGVPEVVEDADTLEGNARLKAAALADATGLPALADDTGLEVDALGGEPGVRSARYGGGARDAVARDAVAHDDVARDDAANVARVLAGLADVGPDQRTARFRTVVMVRWPDGQEVHAEGVLEGAVTDAPRGDNGFGYDPVFAPDDTPGRTLAELAPQEKDSVSHRGRALRALAALLSGAAPR